MSLGNNYTIVVGRLTSGTEIYLAQNVTTSGNRIAYICPDLGGIGQVGTL
jgi:hypothetical protein